MPTLSSQKIIYLFSCQCNGRYVGKTARTLMERINEHIPKCMQDYIESVQNNKDGSFTGIAKVKNASKRSSICQHLYENRECMLKYSIDRFKPVARARNISHLNVLESIYITVNNPEICKQTEYVYRALLF